MWNSRNRHSVGWLMFRSASEAATVERQERDKGIQRLKFGVDSIDDATRGILPDDLILLGSASGVGKTQQCCNIAMANLEDGRRVHFLPLEAAEFEIERRLKYPLVQAAFYGDPNRPRLDKRLNFPDWLLGEFTKPLAKYEDQVQDYFAKAYANLHLHYRRDKFGINELIEAVHYCAPVTDLIILDHVHVFDLDDDNENRAIKEIAKTVRYLALEEQKPIVLVAHLRKRDRGNDDLVPGMEEFHGSSDLFKIATKVITMSPGRMTMDGTYETFFRIPKNRLDGGVTRFTFREFFNPKTGAYEKNKYQLGWAEQKRANGFEQIDGSHYPDWARRLAPQAIGTGGNGPVRPKGIPNFAPNQGR